MQVRGSSETRGVSSPDMSFWQRIFLTLGFGLVISACAGPTDAALPVFLIRSDGLEISQLANLLIQAVSTQLETSAILEAGYPEVGKIAFEPDPSNPNGQLMHCEITLQPASDNVDCLILDGEGSFIRLQVIDWESAAFYAYRVYLVPD